MSNFCPRCGYAHRARDKSPAARCPACGFRLARGVGNEGRQQGARQLADEGAFGQWLLDCLQLSDGAGPAARHPLFWPRLVVFLALFIWGWRIAGYGYRDGEIMNTWFIHLPLLVFHEAGHIFFMPLGNFMQFLGGTLMQLIMPLTCCVVFLFRQRDPLAASFCLWWTAVSFMDIAPYIYDAPQPRLTLLSGLTGLEDSGHDWINILSTLGMLGKAHAIASITHAFAILLMLLAQLWGGLLLFRQFRLPVSGGLGRF